MMRHDNRPFLEATRQRIGALIVGFASGHVGKTFHADELRGHVVAACGGGAPGSADRILRDLRQRGRVSYTVLDRAKSLYRIDAVNEPEADPRQRELFPCPEGATP